MLRFSRFGICFDLDGTLIDSGPKGFIQLCKVAKSLNLPINTETEKLLKSMWGQSATTLVSTIWPKIDAQLFFKKWEELDMNEPFPTFTGTKEALSRLFSFYPLTVLTNRNIRTTVAQLEHNDLLRYFGLITAVGSEKYKKPHPKSFDPILNHYKSLWMLPEDIIFVGDTVEGDWKLAQSLDLEFYAVTCGGMDTREKFLLAGISEDHIIKTVAELPEILIGR